MATIIVKNLRHINRLTFEVPSAGVYLLTGANGSGKTSLLACLRRIGHRNAFQRHFATSKKSMFLDSLEGAEVAYSINGQEVTYAYAGERWVPRPRSQNRLLQTFGYPSVIYVGATAERITAREEDFRTGRARPAPPELIAAANRILGTQRFDALRTVNVAPGSGQSAFVLQVGTQGTRNKYTSERNFSLGELCILKLVRDLMDCANNSLVLIDELELALHPRAQIELFSYLEEMQQLKHLTIIFSTHSVTLLKRVRRNQIILLEAQADRNVASTVGCYPTYALGSIAYEEERAPDAVIYVEDEVAFTVTETLVQLTISSRFNDQPRLFPVVHVVPIGDFLNVVKFLPRSTALLPSTTRSSALLDNDVQAETIQQWHGSGNHAMLAMFDQHRGSIHYLPWTPEVGLIDFWQGHSVDAEQALRAEFRVQALRIRPQDIGAIPAAGVQKRNACKVALRQVAAHNATLLPNHSAAHVQRALLQQFATWHFHNNRGAVLGLINPLL
jgi:energy-coupling factor transporter ATP-binding protein EcfA2